jgi:protease I
MNLNGKKVVVLIGKHFEDREATEPIAFLEKEGAEVVTVGRDVCDVKGKHGTTIAVKKSFEEIDPVDFDALVIPGGKSPSHLRKYVPAVEFVKRFADTGRPIAAICHGGQLLATAGLVKGLTMTGYPGIREEMEEAGARFMDEEVVVDGNFITSRTPEDLPSFNRKIEENMLAS